MPYIQDPRSLAYTHGASAEDSGIPLWLRPLSDWWKDTLGGPKLPQNTGVNLYSEPWQPEKPSSELQDYAPWLNNLPFGIAGPGSMLGDVLNRKTSETA